MADYGLDIAIPFTAGDPDPTLPWADDDDMMLVPGSLALMELAHSANPVSGVPANAADIPNIAWKRLKDLLGSGDIGTLAFSRIGADVASTLVTERSTKGGLHVAVSQTNNTGTAQAVVVQAKAALLAYVTANPDHSYYFSRWDRLTRVALAAAPPQSLIGINPSNNIFIMQPDASSVPSSSPALLGAVNSPTAPNAATGPRFRSIATALHTGTTTSWLMALAGFGTYGAYAAGGTYGNKSASAVLYRIYLEDMTVSAAGLGMTVAARLAQLQAQDLALYTAAVLTAGGRYYNDTFTAPPA